MYCAHTFIFWAKLSVTDFVLATCGAPTINWISLSYLLDMVQNLLHSNLLGKIDSKTGFTQQWVCLTSFRGVRGR